jgi:hypothetical protein
LAGLHFEGFNPALRVVGRRDLKKRSASKGQGSPEAPQCGAPLDLPTDRSVDKSVGGCGEQSLCEPPCSAVLLFSRCLR